MGDARPPRPCRICGEPARYDFSLRVLLCPECKGLYVEPGPDERAERFRRFPGLELRMKDWPPDRPRKKK